MYVFNFIPRIIFIVFFSDYPVFSPFGAIKDVFQPILLCKNKDMLNDYPHGCHNTINDYPRMYHRILWHKMG
jgi:hypothetical protein